MKKGESLKIGKNNSSFYRILDEALNNLNIRERLGIFNQLD